eukprot:2065079-Prymnesium_polylepis.1
MDALGPRGERVSTVNRALVRVFRCPCPLLGGARSRWARNTSRTRGQSTKRTRQFHEVAPSQLRVGRLRLMLRPLSSPGRPLPDPPPRPRALHERGSTADAPWAPRGK